MTIETVFERQLEATDFIRHLYNVDLQMSSRQQHSLAITCNIRIICAMSFNWKKSTNVNVWYFKSNFHLSSYTPGLFIYVRQKQILHKQNDLHDLQQCDVAIDNIGFCWVWVRVDSDYNT